MTARLKLGRIWTVPIQGTYSLLLLVALIAGLAAWQFRLMFEGYTLAAYATAGVFSAILFVWTVFAHETAHVAAARHFGARVKGVTLSALGGETAISGEPASPWQGIAVATSGPGASALCGIACVGTGLVLGHVGTPVLIGACFAWVGLLCLALAVVNLIPAAPLDGGHVLQSLLWAGTGNRVRATAISGYAGQAVGAATVGAAGWFAVRGASPLTVAGVAIMGWPLWRGASAVRRSARQRILLAGVRVGDLPRRAPVVRGDERVAVAARRAVGAGGEYVGVTDGSGQPVRIVSVARLRRAAARHPDRPVGRLGRHATVHTATADEPLADALERTHADPRPIAVMQDGRLVGVVEPDDIRTALREAHPAAVPALAGAGDQWPGRRR